VWGGAALGITQCLFLSHAPKALAAALYVALGWAVLPFAEQYRSALASWDLGLVVAGGVVYSIGVSGLRLS
jgi:hemolysin III